MIKKSALLFMLAVFIISIAGCETVKGTVKGLAAGATEGVKKDWQTLREADAWMRENLW